MNEPLIVLALDEAVNRLAVSMDRRDDDFAVLVDERFGSYAGLAPRSTASLNAFRASSTQSAMSFTPSPCLWTWVAMSLSGLSARRENQTDFVLLEQIARAVARSRLGTAVGDDAGIRRRCGRSAPPASRCRRRTL